MKSARFYRPARSVIPIVLIQTGDARDHSGHDPVATRVIRFNAFDMNCVARPIPRTLVDQRDDVRRARADQNVVGLKDRLRLSVVPVVGAQRSCAGDFQVAM
jgi:hypothetical protein